MEDFGGTCLDSISNAVRKKRSQTSRRPRPDSQPIDESHVLSSPPSDDVSKVSSDENTGSKRKEFNLNQCLSRASYAGRDDENPYKKIKRDDGGSNAPYANGLGRNGLNTKRCSEGVLAPANWKNMSKMNDDLESQPRFTSNGRNGDIQGSGQSGMSTDVFGNENKVKKVKLKVGGVTRTIHANSTSNGTPGDESSTKNSRSSDATRARQRLIIQGNSDEDQSPPSDKRSGLQGIPWKDFSSGGFNLPRENSLMGKISGKSGSGKHGDRSESVRKSKRAPKRRSLNGSFDDDDEDDEIRYLEKLKTSKANTSFNDNEEPNKKQRKLSRVSMIGTVDGKYDENLVKTGSSRPGKDGNRKSRSDREFVDTDYEEEEEPVSDCELEGEKKSRKESVEFLTENKRELTLTTRQRALKLGKDASSAANASLEFPNGLPPAPSKKQKEKLSEVEQQLKKAEAAQRRRTQNEKAARESEAEAIRKILGQDSNRKKKEDKMKKRQEELAQEKAANALLLASSTVRWTMGPSGTVVTFPNEMGLPSLFDSKPYSYPPPRENCAGPSCAKPYKYRDSKSKLPLCSLQCYKAIQEKLQAETTC